MGKPFVSIDVRQDKVELLLNALKVAEGAFTTSGMWEAADNVHKLNVLLRKQIFEFERIEE